MAELFILDLKTYFNFLFGFFFWSSSHFLRRNIMTPFKFNYTLLSIIWEKLPSLEKLSYKKTQKKNETEDYFLQLKVNIQTSIFLLDYQTPLAIFKSKFSIDKIQVFWSCGSYNKLYMPLNKFLRYWSDDQHVRTFHHRFNV